MLRPAVLWVMACAIGLFFVLMGLSKLAGPSAAQWAVRFSRWGYPASSSYVIGAIEIVAGLGLLLPSLRRPAAAALMIVMAGALVTHLIHGEFVRLVAPLILGGLSYGLYWWKPHASQKA